MASTKKADKTTRPYVRGTTLVELGSSGLKRFSGYVLEEFQKELVGRRGMKVYREMRDNSATVGTCLGAIDTLVRQVDWFVKPAPAKVSAGAVEVGNNEDQRRAEFLQSCMHDMSSTWIDLMSEVRSFLEFGFAYHELVYKKRDGDNNDPARRSRYSDGLIGWRKIPGRAQETLFDWQFDPEGGIQAMRQQAPPDYKIVAIPIEKALHFRTRTDKNNPEGRSILRNAYLSYYLAKNIQTIEGIGIERDLNGFPVVWIPYENMLSTATPEQKASFDSYKNVVRNIRRDEQEGLVMPMAYDDQGRKLFDVTLLSTAGRRMFDTLAIRSAYERAIAATMLQDLVFMGAPNTILYRGNKAPQLFALTVLGWLDSIASVLNAHAVPRLFRLNGWSVENPPTICHGDIDDADLAAVGDFMLKAFQSGMPLFPDAALENDIRRKAGFPPKGADAKTPAEPGPNEPPGPDDDDLAPASEDAAAGAAQ